MKYSKLITIIAAFLLTACINRGTKLNMEQVNAIQRGYTTQEQIFATFGEPVIYEAYSGSKTTILTYIYSNSDGIKKDLATIAGAVTGGFLGNTIGDGAGNAIATGVGSVAGSVVGENLVTTRHEEQVLRVIIDRSTGIVMDYEFNERKGRSQPWEFNSGVGTL